MRLVIQVIHRAIILRRLGVAATIVLAGACGSPEVDSRIECSAAEPCPGFMRCETDGYCASQAAFDAGPFTPRPDAQGVQTPDADTLIQVEAEAHTRTESLAELHTWSIDTNREGYLGDGFVIALPDDQTACIDIPVVGCGALLGYDINVLEAGSYYLHVRTLAANGENNSLHYGVDGTFSASHTVAADNVWSWSTNASGVIDLTAGPHELIVWMREDGLRIDSLVLSKDVASPL